VLNSEEKRCKKCGAILQARIETDAMIGKKLEWDCPRCHPERFGLPRIPKGGLSDIPA